MKNLKHFFVILLLIVLISDSCKKGDANGMKIGGSTAGSATRAIGIESGHGHLTIRNGRRPGARLLH